MTSRRLGAVAAVLLLACGGADDGADVANRTAASFVGTTYPPLPDGLASAGMHMFPQSGMALDLVFGSDRQMLWLSRTAAGADTDGGREVVAVLDIPREEQNVQLVYRPGACRLDGTVDSTLVALARFTFTPELDEVVLAWRADPDAGTFATVPAEGVACTNDRYTQ